MTTGNDPQAMVRPQGLRDRFNALSSRRLVSSGLGNEYWSYAARYVVQSLIRTALQRHQRSPLFGSLVIAKALGRGNIKNPTERSVTGKFMFWDRLPDQGSLIFCPRLEWIELGQSVIGALLWLSTRTQPDFSCLQSIRLPDLQACGTYDPLAIMQRKQDGRKFGGGSALCVDGKVGKMFGFWFKKPWPTTSFLTRGMTTKLP